MASFGGWGPHDLPTHGELKSLMARFFANDPPVKYQAGRHHVADGDATPDGSEDRTEKLLAVRTRRLQKAAAHAEANRLRPNPRIRLRGESYVEQMAALSARRHLTYMKKRLAAPDTRFRVLNAIAHRRELRRLTMPGPRLACDLATAANGRRPWTQKPWQVEARAEVVRREITALELRRAQLLRQQTSPLYSPE